MIATAFSHRRELFDVGVRKLESVEASDVITPDSLRKLAEALDCELQYALVMLLPPKALRFSADVLRQMAKRELIFLMPQKTELTTQEAAAFLNVSRPFVIKEIVAQRLHSYLVNRHRRFEFEELLRYQKEQIQRSESALKIK